MKPATDYEAKAKHWHPEYGYGPWSDVYTLRSVDEPPPLVVCERWVMGQGYTPARIVTHISAFPPTYIGMFGSQTNTGVIRFTNPDSAEWEYGFKLRSGLPTKAEIVVRSDQSWEVRTYETSNNRRIKERVLHSGIMPRINTRLGETNEVRYSPGGAVGSLWVNGEVAEFDRHGPIGRWLDLIVVRPYKVDIAVKRILWGRWCNDE